MWANLLSNMGIPFEKKESGILMCHCVCAAGRNVLSVHIYPHGYFNCECCGYQGNFQDFVADYCKLPRGSLQVIERITVLSH